MNGWPPWGLDPRTWSLVVSLVGFVLAAGFCYFGSGFFRYRRRR